MDINFPPQVRAAIYVLVVLGGAILVPLNATGNVSDTVLAVYSSVAAAASLLARLNVSK